MKKIVCGILAGCLVLATATGCQKNASGKTPITLNEVAHSIFYAPQYAAIELGYFDEEGLDVTLVNGGGADKVMTALVSGEADIGFMGSEASVYTLSLIHIWRYPTTVRIPPDVRMEMALLAMAVTAASRLPMVSLNSICLLYTSHRPRHQRIHARSHVASAWRDPAKYKKPSGFHLRNTCENVLRPEAGRLFPFQSDHRMTTSAPKGRRASFASLNCWRPKGIPRMVTQRRCV